MAYDEAMVGRIRQSLANEDGITERKMFGGIAFMKDGNMVCGPVGASLMVRVGPAAYDGALTLPHAGPLAFTGRPMKGMVQIAAAGLDGESLREWVDRGLAFARTLPPK